MTNSDFHRSADICDAAVDRAMTSFQQAVNSMVSCKRCNGTGYHHGFGEHGHDPDWCEVCGGCQSVPEFNDREAMCLAIKAALSGAVAQGAADTIAVPAKLLHSLWCYGTLQTIKGVVYSYGTHEACLNAIDDLIADHADEVEQAAQPPASPPAQPVTNVSLTELAKIHAATWGDRSPSAVSMLAAFGKALLAAQPPAAAADPTEIEEDDPDALTAAKAIAEHGFGRPWDDFPAANAFDTDQGDLLEYGRAAVSALRVSRSSAATEHERQHDHRVYFMCECCQEHDPENGVSDRSDIGVMPDGTWLCDNCYSDCDKTAYGMVPCDVDDFEFPRFEDLPRPAPYPVQHATPNEPQAVEVTHAAQFLLDRLDEFDPGEDEPEREYHGHVAPAIARLRAALNREMIEQGICPHCGGDCSAANPPVYDCPMQGCGK